MFAEKEGRFERRRNKLNDMSSATASKIRLTASDRISLASSIKTAVDAACVKLYSEGHRSHLGASVIGGECDRAIWYAFRHVLKEAFSGRQLRLFNRGHKEEDRIIEWLRLAGLQVWDRDDANGNQFRIAGVGGHFGGSLDGVARLDAFKLPLAVLLEFKTHNAKSFAKLQKLGVAKAKPAHFSQMCSYGSVYQFDYALYCAINKNDDEIYIEIVELNHSHGVELINKAERLIMRREAPGRISANPSFLTCKFCPFSGVCHNGEPVEVNCRSCRHARPVENAEWACDVFDMIIPRDKIPLGCAQWRGVQ